MLPFREAIKLPFYFYGSVKFTSLKGKVVIEGPVQRAMVGFGQQFEMATRSAGIAELNISGDLKIKGYVHIGKDCLIYVGENSICEFGNMTLLGSKVKLYCTCKIVLGDWARIGYESQILDTNFHNMLDLRIGNRIRLSSPIVIGNYNSISNRNSILQGTKTPNYCVVASNSLLNKDYSNIGNNVLLGGIPAKLIKENFSRDWEGEREGITNFLIKFK